MITKEQAIALKHGTIIKQVRKFNGTIKAQGCSRVFVSDGTTSELPKPVNWRINGKCQTWKTIPQQFKIPIKHGLRKYDYLTDDNAHLFELME